MRKTLFAIAALLVPSVALAGSVMVKNKDAKEVTIIVHRSGSSTETGIAGKTSMDLPGAPLTVTIKKTKQSIDATDGETVVIEKGKLTKLPPEDETDNGGGDEHPKGEGSILDTVPVPDHTPDN
jgi:hypothetical protein